MRDEAHRGAENRRERAAGRRPTFPLILGFELNCETGRKTARVIGIAPGPVIEALPSETVQMARRLRHEDPRQGREHFDLIAGREWERGPDPNDIRGSIGDVPRTRLGTASVVIHSKGQWMVTDFGLEVLSDDPDRNYFFRFSAAGLLAEVIERDSGRIFYKVPLLVALEDWVDLECFGDFEDCFYAAMPVHCRAPLPTPKTFMEFVIMDLHERKHGKRSLRDQPCSADVEVLERTFSEARAIVEHYCSE